MSAADNSVSKTGDGYFRRCLEFTWNDRDNRSLWMQLE